MKKGVNLYIPWRDTGCSYRKKHFEYLKKYYSSQFNVIEIDSTYPDFNRSNARNRAVEHCQEELLVIVDADNYIKIDQINFGISLSKINNCFVRPFNSIHYLNKNATERFYINPDKFIPSQEDYEYMPPQNIRLKNSGGAYIVIKSMWESIGGMDEQFLDWGAEDLAFNEKYIYYYGDKLNVSGPNYNLHHPADRVISDKNWERYLSLYKTGEIYKK